MPNITISINGVNVLSKQSMNVLGVQFDAQLNWSEQVSRVTTKAKQSLHAIRIIKKYFSNPEIRNLLHLISTQFSSTTVKSGTFLP